jgi:hypothetical protein
MRAMPSRARKRWSPRLRTAGALLLLAGAVGLADRVLAPSDPVLGPSPAVTPLALALLAVGAISFYVGRRWR